MLVYLCQLMKKIIAFLLLLIFVSSISVQLYNDLCGKNQVSFSKLTAEDDDSEKKETENEKDFEKDKIVFEASVSQHFILSSNSIYYISQSSLLPNPCIAKEINPPNAKA